MWLRGLKSPQTYTSCIVGFLYSVAWKADRYGGRDTHHLQWYRKSLPLRSETPRMQAKVP
ncbi:hypothetical protein SAMN05421819_1435 [Bryocella elongata]|uniref:Uncharacterized protein n=1 Tax=Bryocella elongata TaxID=863522 RepID=A0A1H5W531_9BACT|nr:hypothetical protein SAMN05421819_1435 [Bryocella elongata]